MKLSDVMSRADLLRYQRQPYRERLLSEPHRTIVERQRARMETIRKLRARQIGYDLPGLDLMVADATLASIMIEAGYKDDQLVEGGLLPRSLWPARDTTFCECVHQGCGSPIWVLEADLARSLAETEPPVDVVTEGLLETSMRLPYPALFVATPPVFDILDDDQGTLHALEGFFVAEVWGLNGVARERAKADPESILYGSIAAAKVGPRDFTRGIMVVAVGKAIGMTEDGNLDDCVLTVTMGDGGRPKEIASGQHRRVWALAVSFILALNGGYLETRKVKARGDDGPVSKKKERKLRAAARRGEVRHEHVVVSLSKLALQERARRFAESNEKDGPSKRPHWVRGHWHSYWRKDPGQLAVHEVQEREGVPWYRCLHWIMPYMTGMGAAQAPTYRVVR